MKHPRLLITSAILTILVGSLLSGCARAPLVQVIEARQVYTNVLQQATTASQLGILSVEQMEKIEAARIVAAEAIDALETAALAQHPLQIQQYLRAVQDGLNAFIRITLESTDETEQSGVFRPARPGSHDVRDRSVPEARQPSGRRGDQRYAATSQESPVDG